VEGPAKSVILIDILWWDHRNPLSIRTKGTLPPDIRGLIRLSYNEFLKSVSLFSGFPCAVLASLHGQPFGHLSSIPPQYAFRLVSCTEANARRKKNPYPKLHYFTRTYLIRLSAPMSVCASHSQPCPTMSNITAMKLQLCPYA